MAFSRSEKLFGRLFSLRGLARFAVFFLIFGLAFKAEIDPITSFTSVSQFFALPSPQEIAIEETKIDTLDKNEAVEITAPNSVPASNLFSIPAGFESRVAFWINIYSKYTAEDAVFHDSQNLAIVYKVVDLRPIMSSKLHPFVKEHKVKRLIEKARANLISQLNSLKRNLNRAKLNDNAQELYDLLGQPKKKADVAAAIDNLRMQLGQKTFVEQALQNSDLYLPTMEKIFEKKGLPKELTRIPFVESSFNLAARSRVGASGIWQIMPATGRKLMPNSHIDYRNDPIKATEFAATLLKFNYKVIDAWPLAVTAYNHGPTSISKLTKKYKTKDLPTLINKVYGTHAFAFASSNFYACFLAILEIEKNRSLYFPEVPRNLPLDFSSVQLKKSIKYSQLLTWFGKDTQKTDLFNPHLSSALKHGGTPIPAGTYLYIPAQMPEIVAKDFPRVARKI